MKRTGTEMEGVAAGSPLKYWSAMKPAAKDNTMRAGGMKRLSLIMGLLNKPVLNCETSNVRETLEIAVGGNEDQLVTLGESGDP